LGPWTATIGDGSITVTCTAGDANLSGIEVWSLSGAAAPSPGLVAHWRLDGSGADASGNGNTGTPSPNGPVWTAGKVGGGLDFNGVDDSFSAPSSASLNSLKGQMTAAAWVYKRANAPSWGGLMGRRRGTGVEDLWVLFYNASASDEYMFAVTTSAGSATLTGPSGAGDLNRWVHVAAVYDGGSMILYRDGAEVARRAHSGTIADESSGVILGAGDNGTNGVGEYLNAVLDDARLYNRALSASEIQSLYNGGAGTSAVLGVMAESPGPASSSGGGSCGLLGLEALAILGLARLSYGRCSRSRRSWPH
jgi:hypothetical protein